MESLDGGSESCVSTVAIPTQGHRARIFFVVSPGFLSQVPLSIVFASFGVELSQLLCKDCRVETLGKVSPCYSATAEKKSWKARENFFHSALKSFVVYHYFEPYFSLFQIFSPRPLDPSLISLSPMVYEPEIWIKVYDPPAKYGGWSHFSFSAAFQVGEVVEKRSPSVWWKAKA